MAWVYLIVAGLFEVAWASAMKQSDGFSKLGPTVFMGVTMIASLWLLALAMKTLPLGTSYMIWTGIGAVGAFIVGIWFFGEDASPLRLIAAGVIVLGIALMKVAS